MNSCTLVLRSLIAYVYYAVLHLVSNRIVCNPNISHYTAHAQNLAIPEYSYLRFLQRTGHPFDLTKVRLQTAPAGTYTGALDVVKQTLARDGVKG